MVSASSFRLCVDLARLLDVEGWRQSDHLVKKIKKLKQTIGRIAASKSPSKKDVLQSLYGDLLDRAAVDRASRRPCGNRTKSESSSMDVLSQNGGNPAWIELTEQVCDTAYRRVLLGESVPNCDKLFSLFETHTQLYRRGKAGQPNQYGRLVLVYEDGAGFISHYHLLDREPETGMSWSIKRRSSKRNIRRNRNSVFDRGFHSDENEASLREIVDDVCVLPRHPGQYAERLKNGSVKFHQTRLHHSGVESAIGALQRGNGLKRCRDRSEIGFERYFGLAVLGRNIHTLGKQLLSEHHASSVSAHSLRRAA